MSATRLATIPFEHVEAELAAFPLSSEASFQLAETSLHPLISRKQNEKLWRAAESDILHMLPSVPPDEALTIRDRIWFHRSNPLDLDYLEPIPLSKYLLRLAATYLDIDGRPIETGVSGLNSHRNVGPGARLRWSWMCRAMPPDLLRTARGVADADEDPFPLTPVMQQMLLDRGFAETHLHLSASLDFSLAWAALMRTLAGNESRPSDFESLGACFEDGHHLCTWLLYAATARLLLAQWMFAHPSTRPSFGDIVKSAHGPRVGRGCLSKESCDEPDGTSHELTVRRLDPIEVNRLATVLSELRRGRWFDLPRPALGSKPQEQLARRFAQTRALYRRLVPSEHLIRDRQSERLALHARYNPETRKDVYADDPLSPIVGWHPTERISPETIFVSTTLRYLEDHPEEEDGDLARLFWQMIRVRCLLYRHVVQRPLTPGLQWFVRSFARIKPLRKNLSESVLASTAEYICGKKAGLRSLEVRIGTEEGVSDCVAKVRQIEEAMFPRKRDLGLGRAVVPLDKEEASMREVGVLFHFSRKRGGGWERGSMNAYGLDHSYPGIPRRGAKRLNLKEAGNPAGFRFAHFYLQQRRHAQALVGLFRSYPRSLRTVRGVDLCTDEVGVPVWVMAPLVLWVLNAGRQAAIQLGRRGESIAPLRRSIHAGEDFIHLLTGLRGLDEAITYLQLEEGDRLGHALALGVNPSVWCGRVGRVLQRREERLIDLVWEWRCYAGYSEYGVGAASERLAYVRTEISRLAQAIFNGPHSPEDLLGFVDLLHDARELRALGFPDKGSAQPHDRLQAARCDDEPQRGARRLLTKYLRSEEVWRRGRVPEIIDLHALGHEQAALSQLQDGLRRKVGKLCLTIEVNPSSNLLVGDLGNFVGHPLWRLKPVVQRDDLSPLSVCIGSDDPLTFATTLRHEYQLLFDTLILMGHSHEVASGWIDAAREAGMQSRFTIPPNVEQICQGLKTPNLLGWERPESPP